MPKLYIHKSCTLPLREALSEIGRLQQLVIDIRTHFERHGMHTSAVEISVPAAEQVTVTEDSLTVDLSDGRSLSVPLAWFPRLVHATPTERKGWRLIGRGQGIHWDTLDEDISVEGLLAGKPSGESQASLKKWLAARRSRVTRGLTRRRNTTRH